MKQLVGWTLRFAVMFGLNIFRFGFLTWTIGAAFVGIFVLIVIVQTEPEEPGFIV